MNLYLTHIHLYRNTCKCMKFNLRRIDIYSTVFNHHWTYLHLRYGSWVSHRGCHDDQINVVPLFTDVINRCWMACQHQFSQSVPNEQAKRAQVSCRTILVNFNGYYFSEYLPLHILIGMRVAASITENPI